MGLLDRLGRSVLVAVLVCGVAASCTPPDPDASPQTTAPADPAPTPQPTVTVTVTPPPAADVLLTDQGIGPVALGTPGAYDALLEVLGEATKPPDESCAFWEAEWDSLTVFLNGQDGAVTGWFLGGGRLDDRVRPPFDIYPGDRLDRVLEEGGRTVPSYSFVDETEITDYETSIGAYVWSSATDEPDSPVAYVSVNLPGCE